MQNTTISNGARKFLLVFSIIFVSFFAQNALAAQEQIENYDVEIEILSNSTLYVTETIEYNFGSHKKHGIYRDIPILQKDYKENQFKISEIKVTDDSGKSYNFTSSKNLANLNIKIGDEDKFVTGTKFYIISYKVEGAWIFDEQADALFWNAIGTDWDVPILKNSIAVYLPENLLEEQFEDKCYWGIVGSIMECEGAFYVGSSGSTKNIESIFFKTRELGARQGVTVNLYLEKAIITQPPLPNQIIAWLKNFGYFFPPIIILIFMLYLWYTRGRDPEGRGNIIAQYDPPKDMMPAEMGVLLDESVDSHDLSSEIIYLAIQGYIKIRRIEKKILFGKQDDYILEKLKEPNASMRDYQIKLLNKLFGKPSSLGEYEGVETSPDAIAIIKLSDLKKDKNVYKWIKKVEDLIHDSATKHGYFDQDPKKVKNKYALGFLLVFIGVPIFGYFGTSNVLAMAWGVSIAVCGLIIAVIGMAMPKRTIEGVLLKEHILGLKEYIDVAEKDRIKFHNDPAKDPAYFEKLLPYAMVFKLEKKWAKKFEGIYTAEPNWYASGQAGHFSAVAFGNSLGDFRTSSVGSISASSSGGGGGGGSW